MLLAGPLVLAAAPALVVPLVLYALCNTPRAVNSMRRMTGKDLRASAQECWVFVQVHWFGAGIVMFIGTWVGTWALAGYPLFQFWMQVATGNWTPDDSKLQWLGKVERWLFALSILTGIVLNLGPWLWAIGRFRELIAIGREIIVRHERAIASKEQMQKQRLYALFNYDHDKMDVIEEGFKLGFDDWKSHLGSMYSPKEVRDFLDDYHGSIHNSAQHVRQIQQARQLEPKHAIAAKEQMQKQRLYVLFDYDPQIMGTIDKGFEEGADEWRAHVSAMYPQAAVRDLFRVYPGNAPQSGRVPNP